MEERYEFELAHSERVLDDVERALERLSEGSYDSCETCGAPILGADLSADPTRRVCEQHLPLDHGTEPAFSPPTSPPG
jgi:RNA polymerase-binding transcription factor DksA